MAQFDNMQACGLTPVRCCSEGRETMTRTPLLITLAAAAALAGCNKESHTIVAGRPADERYQRRGQCAGRAAAVDRAPARSIAAPTTSSIYVNWLSDNKSRNVRTGQSAPIQVSAAEAGQPMTGPAAIELSGTATARRPRSPFPAIGRKAARPEAASLDSPSAALDQAAEGSDVHGSLAGAHSPAAH